MSTLRSTRSSSRIENVTDWRAVAGIVSVILLVATIVLIRIASNHGQATRSTSRLSDSQQDFGEMTSVHGEGQRDQSDALNSMSEPEAKVDAVTADNLSHHEQHPAAEPTRLLSSDADKQSENTLELWSNKPGDNAPKLRHIHYDFDLLADLQDSFAEVSFIDSKSTLTSMLADSRTLTDSSGDARNHAYREAIANRLDKAQLQLATDADCRMRADEVPYFQTIAAAIRPGLRSRPIRTSPVPASMQSYSESDEFLFAERFREFERRQPGLAWTTAAVPALVQLLQIGPPSLRLDMVRILNTIKGRSASSALVDRAVFDLSPEVREAAIAAIKTRPEEETTPRILWGLRHPWVAAAQHAAEALVVLERHDQIPQLLAILDEPRVDAPFQDEHGNWKQLELVKVNHMRNCLLCHPPSGADRPQRLAFGRAVNGDGSLHGSVPAPDRPIRAYYSSIGAGSVRADYVNLRQDFSVMEGVPDAAPWPEMQRFDYLRRFRIMTADEVDRYAREDSVDPHKMAAKFALALLAAPRVGTSVCW